MTPTDGRGTPPLSVGTASTVTGPAGPVAKVMQRKFHRTHKDDDWEIMRGLKLGETVSKEKPQKHEGYVMKRRKWPLKGWHRRFFFLENGTLSYAKNSSDMARGRFHGQVDLAVAFISYKAKEQRIDIDADESIFHLKLKDPGSFDKWIEHISAHRRYKQQELSKYENGSPRSSNEQRVLQWVLDASSTPTTLSERLAILEKNLATLEDNAQHIYIRPPPRKKPPRKRREDEAVADEGVAAPAAGQPSDVESAAQAPVPEGDRLSELSGGQASSGSSVQDSSSPGQAASDPSQSAQEFVENARQLLASLQELVGQVENQQNKRSTLLRTPLVTETESLRSLVTTYKRENADLEARLAQIRRIVGSSTPSETPQIATPVAEPQIAASRAVRRLVQEASHDTSSMLSTSEFYDAAEQLSDCAASSSEGSFCSEGDTEGEASDDGTEYNARTGDPNGGANVGTVRTMKTRRTKLPVPKPQNADNGLWSLLYKNIGKDLSKVSMPVTINEPLNMLQRLCEELEYSELIDKAAETKDAMERMVHIAAFAVSGYASSYYRAGHKPFNPLLGETYECIREDKGFRFIAEQVQHHPPISACFVEGQSFTFWQDIRMKTKFWGKSMEIMPVGLVHLQVADSHYVWNKVTTCVHNLFSNNQRWADQYGEMKIEDINHKITCKLTFVKASYWSDKKHEVYGSVLDAAGNSVHHLMGKWTEGIYCGPVASTARCVWRPGQMPEDYELYYGFSRYAMQLNELDPDEADKLPITDTRFRPDQRLLENGDIAAAEAAKAALEQHQRERRKKREERGEEYYPQWFRKVFDAKGEENWVYNSRYWETREKIGFKKYKFPEKLWDVNFGTVLS
ncbi:oxysterol-binding protein-related protein 6 [Galendromus occidentalis]|uniref:Oxysterol-binding protein-related protein 6 n=1 Tax=Galendromus occidentalis TaxID=34638 RepID=A0AAJ7SCN6_9ACAR|nr:oxysterol-binding protein-related protein 6 [Galendromus occidentalis]